MAKRRLHAISAGLFALLALPTTVTTAEARSLVFTVTRDGDAFGRHEIVIRHDGARTEVENSASARVSLGPVVLFTYAYTSSEVWKNNRLERISATTDDDGDIVRVSAKRSGKTLKVTGPNGAKRLSADILPTSFWTDAVAQTSVLLDTQTGHLDHVKTVFLGTKQSPTGLIHGYRLSGDLQSELWYDAQDLLVSARFRSRGSVFEYTRTHLPPQMLAGETAQKNGS